MLLPSDAVPQAVPVSASEQVVMSQCADAAASSLKLEAPDYVFIDLTFDDDDDDDDDDDEVESLPPATRKRRHPLKHEKEGKQVKSEEAIQRKERRTQEVPKVSASKQIP
jgi:hypothetical protein